MFGAGESPPNRVLAEAQRQRVRWEEDKRQRERALPLAAKRGIRRPLGRRQSEGFVVRLDDGQHRVCLVTGTAAARLPHNFRAEARTHFICDLEETT